jgi:phage terminase small subunit
MPKLNARQRQFVVEYLIDLNGTAAAIRAGYSPKTAAVIAAQLLSKKHIQDAVALAMNNRSARTEITGDMVMQELAKIAFSDIRDFVYWTGSIAMLKPGDSLKDGSARCIAEISGNQIAGVKLKLYDKISALDKLARHLGSYNPDKNKAPVVVNWPLGKSGLDG